MLQPPNMTSSALDPTILECRIAFLRAVEKYMPAVLRDLEIMFERQLTGPDLDRTLIRWAELHHIYPWAIKIARGTLARWERGSQTSRTRWRLPQVQTAAVWDAAPFSCSHRGYQPHIDGEVQAYTETLRRKIDRAFESHVEQLKSAEDLRISEQSVKTSQMVNKRSRDGRDKYVGAKWLAMKMAGMNPAMIAKEDQVDLAAVVRQIKWAESVLLIG